MTFFDLFINLIESFTTLVIVNLVYQKKEYLKLFIFTIISFITVTLVNIYSFDYYIFILIDTLLIFTYSSILSKCLNIKNIFISIISINSLNIALIITFIPYQLINNEHFYSFDAFVVCAHLVYLIIIYLFGDFIRNTHYFNNKLMILSNVSLILINLLFTICFDWIFIKTTPNSYGIVLLLLILLVLIILLFNESKKDTEKLIENQLQINILEQQKDNYELSIQNIERTNKLKHDIGHIYNSISYEIKNNNLEAALNIITEQTKELRNLDKVILTGNDIIDYCIALQSKLIREKEISIVCDRLPSSIPIYNQDLFIVFGNLIKNAVEHCETDFDNRIFISAGTIHDYFYLKIKNTVTHNILKDNPYLETTKLNKDVHGLGIKSCRDILAEYNGQLFFEVDDDIFFSTKMLLPKKIAKKS